MLPIIYISTNHLHRLLRKNFFSATENEYFYSKEIRTLHVQISPFRLKYTPSSCLCAVDVRINQFVVAHFLPIRLNLHRKTPFHTAQRHLVDCFAEGKFRDA
jgi:hypothetical protein